jgi:flagellar hook-length control protein FliK
MSSPIASNKNVNASPNAVNGSSLGDLASRLAAQQAGSGAPSFAQLMSQQQASSEPAPKPASAPARPAQAAKAPQPARAPVPVRPQAAQPEVAMQAQRPADRGVNRAEARNKPAPTKEGQRTESSEKPAEESSTRETEEQRAAAAAEGGPLVQELQPPAHLQPGDAAGLMAWLAGQAEADALAAEAAAALSGDEQGEAAATQGTQAADLAGQGTVALDPAAWRQASGTLALQADAMLSPTGKSGEQKVETDAFASLMAGGLRGAPTPATRTDAPTQSATLQTPVNSPDFAQALSDQVRVWVGRAGTEGPMTAELHLNPAEMGPISVKISLDGQSAQVDFAAAALETRKAIEASMSVLSSALDSVGLSLTGAGVSDQTAQQSFGQQFAQADAQRGGITTGRAGLADTEAGLDHEAAMRPVNVPRPGRLGGLDLYA